MPSAAALSSAVPRTTTQLIAMLVGALDTETRLVNALLDVVRTQRRAVASDDVDGLETANGAAHRILTTLNEARHHRSALNERLGESGDLRLGAIAEWFGGITPPALDAAVTQLAQAARALDAELSINQMVFRAVAASADRQVRVLLGADVPAPSGYGADPSSRYGRSLLLDWRG